uniref:AdoMet-dependent rRNA methyltransferase SPB1 n=1 Tax=Chaetomium thermophilum (strain DSM 1495 / CBS 144.50 / IMI 039719) TaxID=759272 RepID=UPI0024AA039F|nr:Chain CS, AdoMet-dependent rRNA methyltransferase SPB1 [Thermochaetoides thermophila DSM 1495]
MAKTQKKHGKGRLDKWYKLAKEKGYRARAAFKLIQLNKKYGFLEKAKVVLDLCAAPGSWCQVCAETMPKDSLIIGVDLAPIKPIPKVITFQSDITTEKCRATIRSHLKTWKADVVLHDGAPNVGTAWVQDSYNQAELALHSLKLATEFLIEGGTFVTKVFRSKDYNKLLWVCNQLFTKVEATKPPSSRNVSAEIFVVCRGFKAPKRIDPRLLDPRSIFEDLADPAPNNEARVYNPEQKKRKREGYEEGDYTQYKETSAIEFINTTDPIAILANYNKLSFEQPPNGDVALAALEKLPETTKEIRACCDDLKVLGKKDFRLLLKWRLRVREIFGLPSKKTAKQQPLVEEEAKVEPMDEELKIQEELERIKEKERAKKKRERRKENERKHKEIVRMQMHMTTPMDIGMEQEGPRGDGAFFRLKEIDQTDALRRIAKGKMAMLTEAEQADRDSGIGLSPDTDDDSDEDGDQLERELDAMYEHYKERKASQDAKYRAKRARQEVDDEEWEGLSADEKGSDVDMDDDDSERLEEDSSDEEAWSDDEELDTSKPLAEAMTLAHQLATGEKTKADLIDEGYNKYAFKQKEGLPDWFLEDEAKHDKPIKPITKEAAQAIKEKLRALNARPIKKVAEARARRKLRQAKKLEKLKKKADLLVDEEGMSEKEKATTIAKMLSAAARKKRRPQVKVVKATGANRGIKGRPKGVKGRYKMVDGRMKKEMRALKRLAKKKR